MREIVVDTETTGLDPADGHRIVEIGCIELVNHIPSGRNFHTYLNPERDMPSGAEAVHGLSAEKLTGEPRFAEVAARFLDFIGDAPLIIHNAAFDLGFLNAELARLDFAPLAADRVLDTLALARRRHPGAGNSLDALCRRYGIDCSKRTLHGALLDSELLAGVYLELIGGHQAHLDLSRVASGAGFRLGAQPARARPAPLPPRLTALEAEAHAALVATLGSGALWLRHTAADRSQAA